MRALAVVAVSLSAPFIHSIHPCLLRLLLYDLTLP
jgi:hypothetical protein